MNFVVAIDYKFAVALGATAIGIIFAVKMTPDAVERVSIHVVDACKELAFAVRSER